MTKSKKVPKCKCRSSRSHVDCMYCGCNASNLVCGRCAEAGIDHDTLLPNRGIIRGTERKVCKAHRQAKSKQTG